MSEAAPPAPPPPEPAPRNLYLVVGSVLVAMLLASLDNLILGTAMPSIVADLGGLDQLTWVVTAYTLATAVSTPVWGKVGDLYGHKGAFLACIAIFLAGSALAGAAQSMAQLIAFRAVQGVGGGGLMVGALAIITSLVPVRRQGRFQGMIAAAMGVAMLAGPPAGGLITDHLGWRWCFYVNLPLGALALVLVTLVLRLPRRRSRARIDYAGVLTLTGAITAVVLAGTWGGREHAWTSPTILGLGALAVAATAAFLAAERRAAEPLLPLRLFRDRNFSLATLIGFLLGFAMFAGMTFLPVFQQTVQGASATDAGLLGLPLSAAMVLVNMVAGPFITRTGRYKPVIVAGGALVTVGLLLMGRMDTGTPPALTGVYMAVLGLGVGCLMQSTLILSLQSVEPQDIGVGASTATLSRTIGGSLGVSAAGVLFADRVREVLAERGAASAAGGGSAQLDAASLARLPEGVRDAYEHAVAGGTGMAFLLAGAVGAVAFAAAWLVRQAPLRDHTVPAAEPEPEKAAL
ncbi:MDR family MFS transporter [Spirillospora sp. NPDC050679]